MHEKPLQIRAYYSPECTAVKVFITEGGMVASPLNFVERGAPGTPIPAALVIDSLRDKSTLQVLMDDLWACGVRPTEGAGSAGQLTATQRHLDDMRALVFKTKPKGAVLT